LSNKIHYPKPDRYLQDGATPQEREKGKQIGDTIVAGDFTAFARLDELNVEDAAAFHAERTNWNHEQYNERAGKETLRIFAPTMYAQDIWLSAALGGNKTAIEAMDRRRSFMLLLNAL